MIAPLFPHPPTLTDEAHGVCAWFFDATATIVDQVAGTTMSAGVSRFLTQTMEAELMTRYVRVGRKVTYVHDWRGCVHYEPGARQQLVDWGRASRKHTEQVSICLSPGASPFMRIATATGVSVLRTVGMRIALIDSLDAVVARLASGAR